MPGAFSTHPLPLNGWSLLANARHGRRAIVLREAYSVDQVDGAGVRQRKWRGLAVLFAGLFVTFKVYITTYSVLNLSPSDRYAKPLESVNNSLSSFLSFALPGSLFLLLEHPTFWLAT